MYMFIEKWRNSQILSRLLNSLAIASQNEFLFCFVFCSFFPTPAPLKWQTAFSKCLFLLVPLSFCPAEAFVKGPDLQWVEMWYLQKV